MNVRQSSDTGAGTPLTTEQLVPFLLSVIASGERLTADEVATIRALDAARSRPATDPAGLDALITEFHDRRWGHEERGECSAKAWMREFAARLVEGPGHVETGPWPDCPSCRERHVREGHRLGTPATIADIITGKPIPLVLYTDDHATDPHTHDVGADGRLSFRYPRPATDRAGAEYGYTKVRGTPGPEATVLVEDQERPLIWTEPADAEWLDAILQADGADVTRDRMWRYGVMHALTLVRHAFRLRR